MAQLKVTRIIQAPRSAVFTLFADLTAAETELKSNGVEFSMDPREFRTIRIAFAEGPDGVRIELVEP